MFYNDVALCNDGSGAVVLDAEVGRQMAEALGDKKALIHQNHGLITAGGSVDAAVWWFIALERALPEPAASPRLQVHAHRDPRPPTASTATRRRAATSPAGSSSSRSGTSSSLASPNSSTNCAPLHLLAARLFRVPGPDAHRSGINDGRDIHNTDTTCLRAGQQAMSAGSMSVVVRRIRPGDASPGGAGRPTECIRVDIRTPSSPRTRDLGVENVSEISGRSRGDVPRMA